MKKKTYLRIFCYLAAVGLAAMAFAQVQTTKPIPAKPKSGKQPIIARPEIVLFSATPPDCRIVKGNFLSYRITGKVRTVEIFAVYGDEHRRRIYQKAFEPFIDGLSDSAVGDSGMDGGIVKFLIKATGPNGLSTERSLDFRTPKFPLFSVTNRNVRRIIVSQVSGATRVRYEADVSWKNIQRVVVRSRKSNGEWEPAVGAHLESNLIWWEIIWNNEEYRLGFSYEIHAFGNDGCKTEDWHFQYPAALAPLR